MKPDDYLTAFGSFVREKANEVEAIRILHSRPQDWNTAALTELRRVLAARPERFTEENLRKAYHAELADIISMVKDAGRHEPLMTAEERASTGNRPGDRWQDSTEEQQRWLDLIAPAPGGQPSIEREDFDELPIFTDCGGMDTREPCVRRTA